ncbi:predicted protein [Postia placenta Mad-698-R]|uniref:Xylanolytic transcriptional activator regulatory domain-containing protein n=1 Tax=Postia placenta MAD-698-R-SB12 TaxID=670580 RepID=A0A1X6N5W5_9APHY|nr:hypothetical protein POSPLADRAFT_1045142 [Postia placenta MAD-698-R-SB12]EED81858.1 predicted protein [Postia placenta Mad-698-R]OSX64008.1 hypothetical protein POSPLADRAFT_1045142 [Postia placenta MAD-698-R-SB12]
MSYKCSVLDIGTKLLMIFSLEDQLWIFINCFVDLDITIHAQTARMWISGDESLRQMTLKLFQHPRHLMMLILYHVLIMPMCITVCEVINGDRVPYFGHIFRPRESAFRISQHAGAILELGRSIRACFRASDVACRVHAFVYILHYIAEVMKTGVVWRVVIVVCSSRSVLLHTFASQDVWHVVFGTLGERKSMLEMQRCDGARPACGQCQRADRAADCEYADGQGATASQILEQQVTQLEGRIAELESAAAPLVLHDPYEAYRRSQTAAQAGPTAAQRTQDQHNVMKYFFRHASEVGFFLHIQRFLQNIAIGPYPDHISALLNAIYLLGAQFSNDVQLQAQQDRYLSHAIDLVTPAMSSGNPSAVIYVLQTEVLLAYYFFDNNRALEGTYHMQAAGSTALACRLHQIRSARPSTGSLGGAQYNLPPPVDYIEEGERVNAFWAAFVLDKCWSTVLGSSPALTDDASRCSQIDVPWPLDMRSYENHPFPSDFRSMATVQMFIGNTGPEGNVNSLLALHAKAASLLESAHRLVSRWDPGNPTFQGNFNHLDSRLERFKQSLPSISRIDPARMDIIRDLFVIHTLVHTATITLHKPTEPQAVASNGRTWIAATAAVGVLQRVDLNSIQYINPIMSMLLTTIADVIVRGIMTAKSQNAINASNRPALMAPLNQILAALDRWSTRSPTARNQRMIVQQSMADL